jgi:hypothetical protein
MKKQIRNYRTILDDFNNSNQNLEKLMDANLI